MRLELVPAIAAGTTNRAHRSSEHIEEEQWVGAKWTVDTYVGDDRAGAIEWTMTGTDNQRPFAVRGSEHYEFRDGRIDQIRQYWTFDVSAPGSELIGYDYGADDRFV